MLSVGDDARRARGTRDAALRVGRAREHDARGGRRAGIGCRARGRGAREARQPDVLGEDLRDLAEHAVPGDAARERGRKRGGRGCSSRPRARRRCRVLHRTGAGDRGELCLSRVELGLLLADRAAGADHQRDERSRHERGAAGGAEDDAALGLETLRDFVAREEVDGTHRSRRSRVRWRRRASRAAPAPPPSWRP